MSLDEETLAGVAQNDEMDYEKWPTIIEPLLERLNHIVHNEFPMPKPYTNIHPPPAPSSPTQTQSNSAIDQTQTTATISQTPSTPVRSLPPVPPFPNSSATSTSHVPDSRPPSEPSSSDPLYELPALLIQLLNGITSTLRAAFSERPPHTIQRLAELVLHPTKHYKTLPAWLRAVDRVVSVSSSADIFPLSDAPVLVNGVNGNAAGGILWGNSDAARNGYDSNGLGSDESLGGALLTPIPWLRNGVPGQTDSEDSNDIDEAVIDGGEDELGDPIELPSTIAGGMPNRHPADPLVPERPDGALTQGELIRMEQEAGVVPVSHSQQSSGRTMAGTEHGLEIDEESEAVPHARGPDVVGAIDIGKVDGKDVQVRIGSPPLVHEDGPASANSRSSSSSGKETASDTEEFELVAKLDSDEMQIDIDDASSRTNRKDGDGDDDDDDDGDIVLVDADGKMDEMDSRADVSDENIGADESDASTTT